MGRETKRRLDEIVLARGWCQTRAQARGLILAGKVRRGTEVLDKPGKSYPEGVELTLEEPPRFVGRGGEKLAGFLAVHPLPVAGAAVLDIGASTGGFTDCLLQAGAAEATCVDVGRGQLHPKLAGDPRVTNLERLNARHLGAGDLPRPSYDLAVVDVSFISLRKILPAVWPFVGPGGALVALVKPQFEASRREVDKAAGVIRDPEVRARTLEETRGFARGHLGGCEEIGVVESPLSGADGNREYLLGLRRRPVPSAL